MKNGFFERVEQKTNVKKEDIFSLAKSIQNKNLKDENELRKLISDVGKLAGREVSKEKESQIIEAIIKNKVPKDINKVL